MLGTAAPVTQQRAQHRPTVSLSLYFNSAKYLRPGRGAVKTELVAKVREGHGQNVTEFVFLGHCRTFLLIQHEATADEKDITELLPKMIILAMRKWNGV